MSTTTSTSSQAGKKSKPMSLKTTIFGLMLAGALLPLGLYSAISYSDTKTQISEFADSNLTRDNQGNARTVQSWITGNDAAIRTAAQASEMGTMDPGVVREFMQRVNAELPVFYAVIAIGKDGVQIARSNIDKLINVGDRPYFKRSMDGIPSTIQSAISKTTGRSFFTVAVPIRDSKKEIVGVLSALAESSQITDKITGSKIGDTGFSYLVSADGSILAHPDIKKIGTKLPDQLKTVMTNERQGRVSSHVSDNNSEIKVTAASAGADLFLISQIDQAEVDAPLKAAQRSLIGFLVGAFFLTLVLSYLLSNAISSKIGSLVGLADRISKARSERELEDLERMVVKVGGARELRLLGASVNRLSASIRAAMM